MTDGFLRFDVSDPRIRPQHVHDIERLNRMLEEALMKEGRQELIDLARWLTDHVRELNPAELFDVRPELRQPKLLRDLIRSLTLTCQLLNLAQQKEIVRATRARHSDPDAPPRPESISEAVARFRELGMDAAAVQGNLDSAEVRPTLTAHPTEARRRSVLEKLYQVGSLLSECDIPRDVVRFDHPVNDLGWPERELAATLNVLWHTDEIRARTLTVSDEVQNALYFFDRTIMPAVAWLHDSLRLALEREYPDCAFDLPEVVRYHSWVGGDRDGNPNVTPEITWKTLLMHKRTALEHYASRVRKLQRFYTEDLRLVGHSEALRESISADLDRSDLSQTSRDRYANEPYRLKLALVLEKLVRTLDDLDRGSTHGYESAAQFVEDLDTMLESLKQNGGSVHAQEGRLAMLAVQARAFGFHLASLDMRQHSDEHAYAVGCLLSAAGLVSDPAEYEAMPESQKEEILTREVLNPRPLSSPDRRPCDRERAVTEVFRVVRRAQEQLSEDAVGLYVVSMTHGVSDLLEVLLLAKETGLVRLTNHGSGEPESRLDVVPLFETIDDLRGCQALLDAIFSNPAYKKQLALRKNFQEIMLGYSDSTKDGGYLMANLALYDAHVQVAAACEKAGVGFRLFHGRGGAIGRGGGRANHAILSQPPRSLNGKIRFTEQGEVISYRYGLAPFAHRHLEQIVHAVMLAEPTKPADAPATEPWHDDFVWLAERSLETYRELVHQDPEFWTFYVQATPIEHISKLPIASRPVFRPGKSISSLDNLRAIPWVFSWTQSRYGVPGWYGLGSALQAFVDERPEGMARLRQMVREWPIFRIVMDNAQSDLVRSDDLASSWYASLVEPAKLSKKFHDKICAERDLSRRMICEVCEVLEVGEGTLERASAEFRSHVVLSLNLLQVAVMREWRAGARDLPPEQGAGWAEALLLCMTGIAAGLQSTG